MRRQRRAEILVSTLTPPPEQLGVTHWSPRLLAAELGVSHSTVARVWAEHDLKPWQTETFKFSSDPALEANYVRHGTTSLFAAVEVATGPVTDACHPRHRHGEFLAFLQPVAKAYPRRQLHMVLDNYATHKHQRVQAWLATHPRVHLHFTPTYASWLNLVEVFFAIIERQALRRGDFASVEQLMAAIGRCCDRRNQPRRCCRALRPCCRR